MKALAAIKKRLLSPSAGHDVFRNMAVLALGTGSAKLIGLAAIPILTRLYTPEHFGVLSVFTALVMILAPVVTLRYVMAIPLPNSDRLAMNLLSLCLVLIVVGTAGLTLLIWALGPWLLPLVSMEALEPYWWLIALGILGTSLYELLTLWATRKKAFKPMARTQVWQVTLGSVVKIGLGLLAVKPLGLLIGQVVQQGGGVVSLTRYFLDSFRQHSRAVSWPRMRFLSLRYLDLPKYRLPSQFLMVFATQAPLLFSAALFGAETTGQLGLALMALGLPIQLFGHTTGKAYFAEISQLGKQQPEKIRRLTVTVIKRLFLLSLAPCVVLLMGGPLLFTLAFGEQWQQAGVFASILSVYLLFQFISSPLVNALTVFDKQKLFLSINLIRTVIIAAVFAAAYHMSLSASVTIAAYSICLALHYLFTLYVVYSNIR
ncbi:oligosaccharide flippase family protein [Halomonas sp. M5N1S17]|uniref:lipopolysaccharide biosynthesis protein n=1 Tax=Halomonas alkalisoli TaxID=2907158 RepID=UPI001F306D77|nr:oligosaccharide flippase family protein [Halomonas alkalisoli]MCE9664977.1 oligosaccharide flippase family protein [Halomonas alkalisoli]